MTLVKELAARSPPPPGGNVCHRGQLGSTCIKRCWRRWPTLRSKASISFERIRYGSNSENLCLLTAWLIEHQVEEVVMKSTAQY